MARNKTSSFSSRKRSSQSFCNKEWNKEHSSCQRLKKKKRMLWKSKKRRNIQMMIMMGKTWMKKKRMKAKVKKMSIGPNKLDFSSNKVLETKSKMIADSIKSFTSCRKRWFSATTRSGLKSNTASSQSLCVLFPLSKLSQSIKIRRMLLASCKFSVLLKPMKQARSKEELGLSVMLQGLMSPKTNLRGFDPFFSC